MVWTLKPCCICTCSLHFHWLILFYGNRYCLERLCWLAAAPSKYRPLIKNQILGSQYRPASTWKRDAVWLVTNLLCSWSIMCTCLTLSIDYKTAFRLDSTQVGTTHEWVVRKRNTDFHLGVGCGKYKFCLLTPICSMCLTANVLISALNTHIVQTCLHALHMSCLVSVKWNKFLSAREMQHLLVVHYCSFGSLLLLHCYSLSYASRTSEWGFLLSLHISRPNSGDHGVLLLWRPPQLPAPKKRVFPKLPSWWWLLSQRLEPNGAHKVCTCVYLRFCKMVVNSWCLHLWVCVCVWLCSRDEAGTGYMPMRPSEKERSSQSGRKSLALLIRCFTTHWAPHSL